MKTHSPPPVALVLLLDGGLVQTPEHLGVAYLLAALREAGLEGRILAVAPGEDERALEELARMSPPLVGLSLTKASVPRAVSFGLRLRTRLGEAVHVTAGGPLATVLGERLLESPAWGFLDSLVRGEGERAVVALAAALRDRQPLASVPSLVYRDADGLRANPLAREARDLDELPWPARDQIRALPVPPPCVRVSTSRGGASRCALPGGKAWRGRSPENVVAELEHLHRTLGARTFDFVDSTFEDPGGGPGGKQRIRRIAELILERGLRIDFNCYMQAQSWSEEDDGLLSLLVRAGLEKVLVGPEPGSDLGLDRWRKRTRKRDHERILGLLRRHGIYVAFDYVLFHPHASPEEIREGAVFLRKHLGHNLWRYTTRLELHPGAEEVERLRAEGLLSPEYDLTFNPFAYRFADEEMGLLSAALARLAGEEYARTGALREEPAHFAFETFDIALHTFIARLRREHAGRRAAGELIEDLERLVAQVKEEMAAYNFELFHRVWERLRESRLDDWALASLRGEVEVRFAGWMNQLRALQLRFGMALRRMGAVSTPAAAAHAGAAP